MPMTRFFQSCPICGRGVLIPVECLGEQVSCRHCRGRFRACDTSSEPYREDAQGPTVMDRANVLLAFAGPARHSYRAADLPLYSE